MIWAVIIAVVLLLCYSLVKSAGMAERKMEELYRLSAEGKVGGLDGN